MVWSRKLVNGVFSVGAAKGTDHHGSDALKVAGTFLIRVESNLELQAGHHLERTPAKRSD